MYSNNHINLKLNKNNVYNNDLKKIQQLTDIKNEMFYFKIIFG